LVTDEEVSVAEREQCNLWKIGFTDGYIF
jgi:hypothetical protein